MLKTFEELKKNFRFKPKSISIDNMVFKLHYRVTTLALLVAMTLVTSQQYIGEHIRCIADKGVAEHVMNTFCFFTTTFTVVKHYNADLLERKALAHPGVGPIGINDDEPIIRHAYYQWVPFVLFGQAIIFYLPHLIWKLKEHHIMKNLVDGLEYAAYTSEKEMTIGKTKIPSKDHIKKTMMSLTKVFIDRSDINSQWSVWLIICEILNMLNVVLQAYFTDMFLQGKFFSLGVDVINSGYDNGVNVLDIVFPKVTKCTFHKYGPSGTVQSHDAMCVMALNIINEKIYVFLWFWFIILFALSTLAVLWRILSFVMHSRSNAFNRFVFNMHSPGHINPWKVLVVTRQSSYADWVFLNYLGGNMDRRVFAEFFSAIAAEMDSVDRSTGEVEDRKLISL